MSALYTYWNRCCQCSRGWRSSRTATARTAAALVFPKLFFPGHNAAAGTLLSFGVYATPGSSPALSAASSRGTTGTA